MPFNVQRSISFGDQKEILKFPVGLHAVKSVVLEANSFAVSTDGSRYVVPAGTILKLSVTVTNQFVKYNGTGTIQGILAHDVDLAVQSTAGAEPVPMFYHGCVFATDAIVDFTQYASTLVTAMPTCKFE